MRKLVIGTRGSALALKQTEIARDAILKAQPGIEIGVCVIKTEGDRNQSPIPLDAVGKGWFTKEIEQELLGGRIDLAVHSLKDMAEAEPSGLAIGAYLEREDARDALVTKDGGDLASLRAGASVGTDSLRRKVQLLALRGGLRVESVRGNVQTRLAKLQAGEYDALVLAAAGLKRLGLASSIARYFSAEEMTPAPGQGILAVEARSGDAELAPLLARITDADAAQAARIERDFSRVIGGGCKAPVGAYASREGGICSLIGMLERANGGILREEARAPLSEAGALGEALAHKMLAARDA